MKKYLKKILAAVAAIVSMASLTGCDEDLQMSAILSGQWRGDFGMFYEFEDRGELVRLDCNESHLYFEQRSAYTTSGWGKQLDHYFYGPKEFVYHYFDWYIEDRVLYIHYPYEPELDVAIYDYRTHHGVFTGYFGDSNTRFYLQKEEPYDDWDSYGYYYAPARDKKAVPSETVILRQGNRNNEPKQ